MAARKERVIVGVHAVGEALRVHERGIQRLWVRSDANPNAEDMRELLGLAQKFKIPVEKKSRQQLDQLAQSHQGVAAFTLNQPELDWDGLKAAETCLVIVLDGIEDPHNLGAILRTAWMMGAVGVIVPQSRAAGLTATASKVACGGAEYVPVEEVSNLDSTLRELKELGFWVYGLAGEGKAPLWRAKLNSKCVLVIGAEDKGIRVSTRKMCDDLVSIPQTVDHASFNASVAAALAMAEWKRAHAFS
jgi:23S rRNA (guanosine2251-2'-O)-methyltransferase